MFKVPNQAYTTGFKAAAVQRLKDGKSLRPVARTEDVGPDLGMVPPQTGTRRATSFGPGQLIRLP